MCLWTCVSESAKSAQSGMTPCDRTERREQNLNSAAERARVKLGERVRIRQSIGNSNVQTGNSYKIQLMLRYRCVYFNYTLCDLFQSQNQMVTRSDYKKRYLKHPLSFSTSSFFLQAFNGEVRRKRRLIMCLTSIHNIHTSTGKGVGEGSVRLCCACQLDCLKGNRLFYSSLSLSGR